jgi:hypothetical protein
MINRQDSRFPGRNLNPGPLKHLVGELISQPRHSVRQLSDISANITLPVFRVTMHWLTWMVTISTVTLKTATIMFAETWTTVDI